MSPVEPSPVVIGRMGWPWREGTDGLCFLPKTAAFRSGGAKMPPVSAPSAARNERRFQPNFSFKRISSFLRCRESLFVSSRCLWRDHQCTADDLDQRITGNPFNRHAGARRCFSRREIGPINLVQSVVLSLMCIKPRLGRGHRDGVRERQAEEYIQMDDTVHVAARTFDRALQRVHGSCDMLFEKIRHEDMIVLGIPVIGTRAGKIVNPVVRVATSATWCISSRCTLGWAAGCGCARRRLLDKEFGHSAKKGRQRCDFAKKTASRIACQLRLSFPLAVNPGYFVLRRDRVLHAWAAPIRRCGLAARRRMLSASYSAHLRRRVPLILTPGRPDRRGPVHSHRHATDIRSNQRRYGPPFR